MKKLFVNILAITLAVAFIAGCAGGSAGGGGTSSGGGAQVSGNSQGGDLAFRFAWPGKEGGSKYIPPATSTIGISITGDGLSSALTRTVAYGTSAIIVNDLPLGNKTVLLTSYDSGGTVLAAGRGEFNIQAGKTAYAEIYMGVVITDSSITPSTFTAPANTTVYFYNAGTRNHQLIGSSPFTSNIISAGSSQAVLFSSSGINTYYLDSASSGVSGTVLITGGPQITRVNPAYGKAGDVITITGTSFGSSQGSSSVSFNGVNASSIISWSNTKIVCRAPAGASTGNVTAAVNGIASTSAAFTATQTTRKAYVAANAIVPVITLYDNAIIKNILGFTGAVGAAAAPSGDYVYVADITTNSVSAIRTSDNTVTATISNIISPMNIAITPNGAYAYVVAGSNIIVIRVSDNTVVKIITGASVPDRLCITPDGSYVYVADSAANSVRAIRTSDNTFIANIAVGTGPTGTAIAPDGSYVYVGNSGGSNDISVIRTSDNTMVSSIPLGGIVPSALAIAPAGDYLYTTDTPGDQIAAIRLSDNAITTISMGAGSQPVTVSVTPDGNYAYVGLGAENNLAVVRLTDNILATKIGLGTTSNVTAITP